MTESTPSGALSDRDIDELRAKLQDDAAMLDWIEQNALWVGRDREIDGSDVWDVEHGGGSASGAALRDAIRAAMAQGASNG